MSLFSSKNMSETVNLHADCGQECSKIIIIGAGIAGLAAGSHLAKNGMTNFRILEARTRVGGRVISINLDNQLIELGSSWIHGIMGNPIYELALANNIISLVQDKAPYNVIATTDEGKRIPLKILQEVYEAYFWFFKRCEEYFLCNLPCPPGITSVGEVLEKEIEKYLTQQFEGDEQHQRRIVFDHLLKRETCISGCDNMKDISLIGFGSFTELPGGNVRIKNGFSSIVDCLSSNIPGHLIYKEHQVKKIVWGRGGQQPLDQPSSSQPDTKKVLHDVTVMCENGKVFYGEHIIVTVPLGVLKSSINELFDPPLPEYKIQSVTNLNFGTVDKIFLLYEVAFLNPEISEVITLWSTPLQGDEPMANTWYRKISSFTKVSDTMLMAWLSGNEAEFAENLPAEEIANTCTRILRVFLQDPYIPKPKKVVRTRWFTEPFTRGSYTSIGTHGTQADIENLSKPIYLSPHHDKPALLFAGEATHPSFYSTTHGAYLSGVSAAQLLLQPESPEQEQTEYGELASWIHGLSLT